MKCKSEQHSYYVDEIINCSYLAPYVILGLLCVPPDKVAKVAKLDSALNSAIKAMAFVADLCLSHEEDANRENIIDNNLRLTLEKRRKLLERRVEHFNTHYENLLGGSISMIRQARAGRYHVGQILDKIPDDVGELEFLRELRRT